MVKGDWNASRRHGRAMTTEHAALHPAVGWFGSSLKAYTGAGGRRWLREHQFK